MSDITEVEMPELIEVADDQEQDQPDQVGDEPEEGEPA